MYKFLATISTVALTAACMVSSAQAQVGINVGSGDTSVHVAVDATTPLYEPKDTVDVDVGAGADADASAGNGSSDTGSRAGGSGSEMSEVRITQEEAATASLDAESAELSAASVTNSQDLSLYATSLVKRDANIEEVHADGDHVSITYNLPARFLGFIPTSISAEATVTSAGEVDIDYPWYRFMFAVEGGSDLETRLQARAQEILAGAGGEAELSASAEAQLLAALHQALSSRTDAAAEATGTTADVAGAAQGNADLDTGTAPSEDSVEEAP